MLKLGGALFAGVTNQEVSKEATSNTRLADAIEEVAHVVDEIDYRWFVFWHIYYIQKILNIMNLGALREGQTGRGSGTGGSCGSASRQGRNPSIHLLRPS